MLPDPFTTARLTFGPLTEADAQPIFDTYAQDREVARYLTWRPHSSVAETEAYVASALAARSRTYLLRDRGNGRLHGVFELRQPALHHLGYGYLLARPSWGNGLMTEALSAVVEWGLCQSGVWRIGDVCDVDNLASARVMEKAGLAREALLRRWSVHPNVADEPRDCFSYARCK
jgi:ribosomal-protein-alanine N-acetyltransferase